MNRGNTTNALPHSQSRVTYIWGTHIVVCVWGNHWKSVGCESKNVFRNLLCKWAIWIQIIRNLRYRKNIHRSCGSSSSFQYAEAGVFYTTQLSQTVNSLSKLVMQPTVSPICEPRLDRYISAAADGDFIRSDCSSSIQFSGRHFSLFGKLLKRALALLSSTQFISVWSQLHVMDKLELA